MLGDCERRIEKQKRVVLLDWPPGDHFAWQAQYFGCLCWIALVMARTSF